MTINTASIGSLHMLPRQKARAISLLQRENKKHHRQDALINAIASKFQSNYTESGSETFKSIREIVLSILTKEKLVNKPLAEKDITQISQQLKTTWFKRTKENINSLLLEPSLIQTSRDNRMQSTGRNITTCNEVELTASQSKKINSTEQGNGNHDDISGRKTSVPPQTDEWVLLNALTLVEHEEDTVKAKENQFQKQIMQKQWLDKQTKEKDQIKEQEKNQLEKYHQYQLADVASYRREEREKLAKQREESIKIRAERDEQLQHQKEQQLQLEQRKKKQDQAEINRIQEELKKLEKVAQDRRGMQQVLMKEFQHENSIIQLEKCNIRRQEQLDDIRLMETAAQRVANEEAARQASLKQKFQRQDQLLQQNYLTNLQQEQEKKRQIDEHQLTEYLKQKDEEESKRQVEIIIKRKQDALGRQDFLRLQQAEKHQRDIDEKMQDLVYAQKCQQESLLAKEQEKRRKENARKTQMEFQTSLIHQMVEQKSRLPLSPLMLPRHKMNSREKELNAKLLEKLQDPIVYQKISEKLSPNKQIGPNPTCFY